MFHTVMYSILREFGHLQRRVKETITASTILLLISFAFGSQSAAAIAAASPEGDTDARSMPRERSANRSWLSWSRDGSGHSSSALSTETSWETEREQLEPFYGCTIDTIVISGNTHTKAVTILREMATKEGRGLDEALIRRDAAHLRGLGYFSEVRVSAEDMGGGRCRLLVAISERPGLFMRVPYPVVNYDFKDGISYGLSWKIKNFRGNGEDVSLSALARRDQDQGAGLSWNIPWFTGRRILFRFDLLGYRRLKEPEYDDFIKEQSIGNLTLGIPVSRSLVRQLWLKTSLSFERRYSRLTLPNMHDGSVGQFCRQDFVSFGSEIVYDSRSALLSPFDGMLHQFRVRRSASVSGLDQKYVVYGSTNCFYLPIGVNRSFIIALEGNVREGDIPTFYEMGIGGVRDLRGFSDSDLRGTAKVVGTVQYRQQLFGPVILRIPRIGKFDFTMNGVLFLDNGALARSILDIPKSILYTTGGLGIEVISPFRDLLRLEVASDGTGKPAFYMTAGSDF